MNTNHIKCRKTILAMAILSLFPVSVFADTIDNNSNATIQAESGKTYNINITDKNITVNGNINLSDHNYGINLNGAKAELHINGDITSTASPNYRIRAINLENKGELTVTGNVDVLGRARGLQLNSNSKVTIQGNSIKLQGGISNQASTGNESFLIQNHSEASFGKENQATKIELKNRNARVESGSSLTVLGDKQSTIVADVNLEVNGNSRLTTPGSINAQELRITGKSKANVGGDITTTKKLYIENSSLISDGDITATATGTNPDASEALTVAGSILNTKGKINTSHLNVWGESTVNAVGDIISSANGDIYNSSVTTNGKINISKRGSIGNSTVKADGDITISKDGRITNSTIETDGKLTITGLTTSKGKNSIIAKGLDLAGGLDIEDGSSFNAVNRGNTSATIGGNGVSCTTNCSVSLKGKFGDSASPIKLNPSSTGSSDIVLDGSINAELVDLPTDVSKINVDVSKNTTLKLGANAKAKLASGNMSELLDKIFGKPKNVGLLKLRNNTSLNSNDVLITQVERVGITPAGNALSAIARGQYLIATQGIVPVLPKGIYTNFDYKHYSLHQIQGASRVNISRFDLAYNRDLSFVDYPVNVGVIGQIIEGKTTAYDDLGSASTRSYHTGVFAQTTVSDVFVQASLVGAKLSSNINSTVLGRVDSIKVNVWQTSLNAKKTFMVKEVKLEPMLSLQYSQIGSVNFNANIDGETLRIKQKAVSSMISRLGMNAEVDVANATVYAGAGINREWNGKQDYQTNVSQEIQVMSVKNRGNWLDLNLGARFNATKALSFNAEVKTNFANKARNSISANLGIVYWF